MKDFQSDPHVVASDDSSLTLSPQSLGQFVIMSITLVVNRLKISAVGGEIGLVEEAAVHEIPALPSDEEVAAIAAEQEAGAAADTNEGTQAEAGQAAPEADESKEG